MMPTCCAPSWECPRPLAGDLHTALFLLHQFPDSRFDLLIAATGHDLGFIGDADVRIGLIVLATNSRRPGVW